MVNRRSTESGSLMIELMTALGILMAGILPLSYVYVREQRAVRSYYWRAVAMEIVDSEMEVLAAGEWRAFAVGAQLYPVRAVAARNLPPSRFQLTRTGQRLRLEWLPAKPGTGGVVVREVTLP
jgi:hypothetical protein